MSRFEDAAELIESDQSVGRSPKPTSQRAIGRLPTRQCAQTPRLVSDKRPKNSG